MTDSRIGAQTRFDVGAVRVDRGESRPPSIRWRSFPRPPRPISRRTARGSTAPQRRAPAHSDPGFPRPRAQAHRGRHVRGDWRASAVLRPAARRIARLRALGSRRGRRFRRLHALHVDHVGWNSSGRAGPTSARYLFARAGNWRHRGAQALATLDAVLAACRRARHFAIVGPTAGCLPDPLFARGVDSVGGRRVLDAAGFLRAFRSGEKWGSCAGKYVIARQDYPGLDWLLERAGA
ncbi:MAG: DUF364 domain-containing protein [Burkholderiales bacterium]